MRRRAIAVTAAAALVAGLLAGCGGGWEDDCSTGPTGVLECDPRHRPAVADLAGELLDGASYDLAGRRGEVVVVNFWASWCAPCRAEADDLEGTYQATRSLGVSFLGVNTNDQRDKAVAFEAGRVGYPSLFDPAGRVALKFSVPPSAIPSTVILDRSGRIAVVIRRATRQAELEPLVTRIAQEPAPVAGGPR